ncbi:catechol O-methyltransferase-like [Sycon ciliatum]|uniref:catechol O-methyltransferase-like n=1 Tax=Sycon ciliatum TaxID=27933 RepID=UPI0031F64155
MTINAILEAFFGYVSSVERWTGVKLDLGTVVLIVGALHVVIGLLAAGRIHRAWVAWRSTSNSGVGKVALTVVKHITENCEPNNPDLALKCADELHDSGKHHLIHIGDVKGKTFDSAVREHRPTVVLELGGYFGYSALRVARLLSADDNAKLYSMEINQECAESCRTLLKFCGVDDRAEVLNCAAQDGIAEFRERTGRSSVDMVVIDHWKPLYLPDLKRLEASGLMHPGTVILADNILYPGVPDYKEYVTTSPKYRTEMHVSKMTTYMGNEAEDAVAISVYLGEQGEG